MSNLIDDYKILRTQVCVHHYNDTDLKELFRTHKYDIINTLLSIELHISGKNEYIVDTHTQQPVSEVHQKIKELRMITNEKDELIRKMK